MICAAIRLTVKPFLQEVLLLHSCAFMITGRLVEGWYESHFFPCIQLAISFALSSPLQYPPCMKPYHSAWVASPAKNKFFTRPAMLAKVVESVPITGSDQFLRICGFWDHLLTRISLMEKQQELLGMFVTLNRPPV